MLHSSTNFPPLLKSHSIYTLIRYGPQIQNKQIFLISYAKLLFLGISSPAFYYINSLPYEKVGFFFNICVVVLFIYYFGLDFVVTTGVDVFSILLFPEQKLKSQRKQVILQADLKLSTEASLCDPAATKLLFGKTTYTQPEAYIWGKLEKFLTLCIVWFGQIWPKLSYLSLYFSLFNHSLIFKVR